MTKKLFVLFAFILMLGTLISYAQVRGAFEGTVTDDQGDPLPGVVVKAESPALLQPRYYTTDENGRYRLIELPPGKGYQLEFRMMGFQTVLRTGLEVVVNKISQVDVQLKEVAFEEQVVITGAAPVLDTTSSTSGVNVDRDFTERLPGSDNYQSSLSMQGGTTGAGNVRVRGGQRFSNLYMFDGVDTTDPLTGTFGANLNADAVAETEVLTGGMPAEFGRVSGGVINTVTKSGGNEFSGSLRLKYFDPSWELDSDYYAESEGSSRIEPTLSIGGPIMKDKLWFFVTYRRIEIEGEQAVRRINWATGDYEETVWDRDELWQYMYAKLTWSITPEHQVFLTWNSDPMTQANDEGLGTGTLSSESLGDWEQGGNTYGLNWTWIVNQNLFLETKIGIGRQVLNIKANSMDTDYTYHHPDTSYGVINLGGLGFSYETDRNRDSVDISAKYFMSDVAGSHEWKTGISYHDMESYGGYFYPDESYNIYLNDSYTFDEYGPYDDPQYWTDDSTRVVRHDQSLETARGKYYAFYVQDKWRPDFIEGFTANIGVRFESHEGFNNRDRSVFKHDLTDMIAPRIGFVWDIGNTGKHKLNIFWGRFYTIWSTMCAQLANEDLSWTETYRWNPDTMNWEFESATSPGENFDTIDPDVKPEYTDEFTIGYEREISTNWSAGISYTEKKTRDIGEDHGVYYDTDGNLLWNGPGTEDLGVYTETIGYYYYNFRTIEEAKRDYWGLELYTNAKLKNLTLMASYTYAEAEGTVFDTNQGSSGITYTSYYYDTPELSENLYGPTPYDVTHYVKLNASYMFNWGTSVGISAFWRSGYHYSKLVKAERITGGPSYGTNVISDEGRGYYELPSVWFADISLQHDFDLGKFGKLTFIADIYNVFDQQSILSEYTADASNFGDANGWAGPMNWDVSILYQF